MTELFADVMQVRRLCYNTFNVPVEVIDANGIVTEYEYNEVGLVTSVVMAGDVKPYEKRRATLIEFGVNQKILDSDKLAEHLRQ